MSVVDDKLRNIPPEAMQRLLQGPEFAKKYADAIKKLSLPHDFISPHFSLWLNRALDNVPFGTLNKRIEHYISWLTDDPVIWHIEILNQAALLIMSSEPHKVCGKWYQNRFSYIDILTCCTKIADEVQRMLAEEKGNVLNKIYFGDRLKAL
jgi:hypothetical protein